MLLSPSWNRIACLRPLHKALHAPQPLSGVAKELARAQAPEFRLLTWDEPEYPQRLRGLYDSPPLLYVRRNIELLNRHQISLLGSRRPTPYGNPMAERLARDLADRVLVSPSKPSRAGNERSGRGEFGCGRADLVQCSYTRRILPHGPAAKAR
jgi:hypothetical protein